MSGSAGSPGSRKSCSLRAPTTWRAGNSIYDTQVVGPSGSGASVNWRQRGDLAAGGGLVGRHEPHLAGSFAESLLRYHRPMLEDGMIEYEFYYRPGESHCHPALDRLAFLLDPAGVRVHWITDDRYDRTDAFRRQRLR